MAHLNTTLKILLDHITKNDAYLDPGSGSFIIQLIIASLVGVGFVLRSYWSKITSFFRGSSTDEEDEDIKNEY